MNWETIAYALACVVVPIAWGLVVVWTSNRIDQRLVGGNRSKGRKRRPLPPIEYHI